MRKVYGDGVSDNSTSQRKGGSREEAVGTHLKRTQRGKVIHFKAVVIRKGRAFDLNGLEFGAIQNSEFAINSIREELIS